MAKVCQLFSGSSGNSIYIGAPGGGILVDIGVSAKRCAGALRAIGVDPDSIRAILVTHEHADHVAGVRVFASRHHVPVFASPATLEEMRFTGIINNTVTSREISSPLDFGEIIAEPFHNSHDAVDCTGYALYLREGRKVSILTDTGYVTDDARQKTAGSNLIFLESNHEVSMLENGPYPYPLKQRILSDKGHLSNDDSARYGVELLNGNTTFFVLSHLSRENNMPSLARQAFLTAFSGEGAEEGRDYRLFVSPPENNGGPIII